MRFAFFWNIARRVVLIPYRHFGTDRLSGISWNLKMETIGCPETSVRNCHYSLRSILVRRSLALRKNDAVFVFVRTRAMEVCRTGGMASCILNFERRMEEKRDVQGPVVCPCSTNSRCT